ncbi:MAG: type II secretion system protein, partial [Candidatus Pacebacteria bacterium]|nr:type II secretion system protein [Candidatus Paceibacterota bacterium]
SVEFHERAKIKKPGKVFRPHVRAKHLTRFFYFCSLMKLNRTHFPAKAKGFTLIELLVVIAIIGLLASIILASLNSARGKGKDTRIMSDISEMRSKIEAEASVNGQYSVGSNYCITAANTIGSSGSCSSLVGDITAQGGAFAAQASSSGFSLYTTSPLSTGAYYCVDSRGNGSTTVSADGATGVCK